MKRLSFPIALIMAVPASAADPILAGTYTTLPSDAAACTLEITASEAFTQICPGRREVRGRIARLGKAFFLGRPPSAKSKPEDLATYNAAFAAFMQSHFSEHGYYPLVAPRQRPEDPDAITSILVQVALSDRVYLVDLFERDTFCAAAIIGQVPTRTGPKHRILTRPALGDEPTLLSWQQLCAPDWTFALQ